MNTSSGSTPPPKDPKKHDFDGKPETAKDRVISELQDEVSGLKDRVNAERFYWILAIIMIVNFWHLPSAQNWGAPIAIVIVEAIFIFALAQSLGMNAINTLFQRVLSSWEKKG